MVFLFLETVFINYIKNTQTADNLTREMFNYSQYKIVLIRRIQQMRVKHDRVQLKCYTKPFHVGNMIR